MIMEKLSILKARLEQLYQDLKSFDEMPFRMIQGDFEEKRVKVRAPRKNHVSVEDLRPRRRD